MTKYYQLHDEFELEVETQYQLGGLNYFNGNQERRGIYLSFDVVTREPHCTTRQLFGALDGSNTKTGKILMLELKRKSQKKQDKIDAEFDFDKAADLWIKKDYHAVFDMVKNDVEEILNGRKIANGNDKIDVSGGLQTA